MLLDAHSHRPAPYPEGIISLRLLTQPLPQPDESALEPAQLYSVGIHPWDTGEAYSEEAFERLEAIAALPQVVMIGECGADPGKGGPLFRQLQVLKRHIDLSERLEKPLVLHCVRSADIILGLKRDLNPSQPWIIHGFRGKPALARQFSDKGLYLSFGEKFNPLSVMQVPPEKILAETDDSQLPIEQIIERLSEAAGRDLLPTVAKNLSEVVGISSCFD